MKSLLIAILLCLTLPVIGRSQDEQDGQRMLRRPDIQKAIVEIWARSAAGASGREAAFTVNGSPENYTIEITPTNNERGKLPVIIYSNTFALFHVHPNFGGPRPSTPDNHYDSDSHGDTWVGDMHHCDMYVVSQYAIWVYYWRTKQTVRLSDHWRSTMRKQY